MRLSTRVATVATILTALSLGGALGVSTASASESLGNNPLSNVMLADGDRFDSNQWDYDVVTEAALAVIDAKGDATAVSLLTKGNVALTAFLPRDIAFYRLVDDLTGTWPTSEKQAFGAIASLGIDTVEKVLLYHVVPGGPIDSGAALQSDGIHLQTADSGNSFELDVIFRAAGDFGIRFVDQDPDLRNPWIAKTQLDINAGNNQVAHGIGRVLIPVNL